MTKQLADLIQQAETLSIEDQLTLIAHLAQRVKSIAGQANQTTPTENANVSAPGKSLWQLADDFMADLPAETLAQLPHDGAAEHDHYIYGVPKTEA